MQEPRLFTLLPEYVCTPDGMAIDEDGNLILACPNFADPSKPGCILKINEKKEIQKWVDVPILEETGHAFPMGIAFGPDWDLYVIDNQGWSGAPELIFKGRRVVRALEAIRVLPPWVEESLDLLQKGGQAWTDAEKAKIADLNWRIVAEKQ